MPGRLIPPPTATVAIGTEVRLAHWEADYIVQRRQPDGSWRTIAIVERDEGADTTIVRRRAAMRRVRDEVMAGTREVVDHDRRESVRWDGADLSRV